MKVLVTGGTGFVGSHCCRQLLAAGHAVRLLVRDPDRARALFQLLPAAANGATPEFHRGDITAPDSVRAAIDGCEAVVHAAAATPMQAESTEQMRAVNVDGLRHVVEAALTAGVGRIICVSSITAIFHTDGTRVSPDAAPAPSRHPYGRSKVQAEHYLRSLQVEGAPVAIVYPGGVIGPYDPGLSDSHRAIVHRVKNGFRIFGDGGMQYVDVRDLAAFICALASDGGSGRFLLPGVWSSWTRQADLIEQLSGCSLRRIPARGWQLRLLGRLVDFVRLFRVVDSPISAETMRYATQWPQIGNSDELAARGLALRSVRETFDDTLRWLVAAGHLDAADCPRLAT